MLNVWGPVDVTVSTDDAKVGVAGFFGDTGSLPAVRIWYGDNTSY